MFATYIIIQHSHIIIICQYGDGYMLICVCKAVSNFRTSEYPPIYSDIGVVRPLIYFTHSVYAFHLLL